MNRWTNYTFKSGKIVKNRIIVPPMASQTADKNGLATSKTLTHYEKLSSSGAGIIFAEYSFIHQSGKGEPNQLGANLDEQIPGLRQISSIIQESDALSGLQIVHVGGKTESILTGCDLIGASPIPVPTKGLDLEIPTEATISQIKQLTQWYVESSFRAYQAGFDIVELHAAHGYGLNQWLSPITNQRTDFYGGSISGRSLLLRKIAMEIKKELPELILAIRLPAQDHFPGGLTFQDMIWVSQRLEDIGVDLIDVSSGIGGWRRPRGNQGQGYLVDDAATIKAQINLPVIGVGGIKTGEFIDSVLINKKTDFAAIGRAILENPDLWYQHNLANSSEKLELAL